ncbi:hypothetical protein BpHYR1_027593, partial [Brachionus plicatilis]
FFSPKTHIKFSSFLFLSATRISFDGLDGLLPGSLGVDVPKLDDTICRSTQKAGLVHSDQTRHIVLMVRAQFKEWMLLAFVQLKVPYFDPGLISLFGSLFVFLVPQAETAVRIGSDQIAVVSYFNGVNGGSWSLDNFLAQSSRKVPDNYGRVVLALNVSEAENTLVADYGLGAR